MENWRQEKYIEINRALELIQKRADKVARVIGESSTHNQGNQQTRLHQQQQHRLNQQNQQVSSLTNELVILQDMTDRLFDFRDRLYFYSNLSYVEALNEWQYEIQRICAVAEGFVHHNQQHRHHHRRNSSSSGNRRTHFNP